ncbi:hypothetical protein ACU4GD_29470 [Cupriavidus basilensis]
MPLRILLFYVLTLAVLMSSILGTASAARAALCADLQPAGHWLGRRVAQCRGHLRRGIRHQ